MYCTYHFKNKNLAKLKSSTPKFIPIQRKHFFNSLLLQKVRSQRYQSNTIDGLWKHIKCAYLFETEFMVMNFIIPIGPCHVINEILLTDTKIEWIVKYNMQMFMGFSKAFFICLLFHDICLICHTYLIFSTDWFKIIHCLDNGHNAETKHL